MSSIETNMVLTLKKTPDELAKLCRRCGEAISVYPEGYRDEMPPECPLRAFHCPLTWGCAEISARDWEQAIEASRQVLEA